MDTFEVCISWIVTCFTQSFETCLHQGTNATTQNCLLTEQVCFCFCSESCLQKTSSCSTDCQTISQCSFQSFSCSILFYSYQTRSTFTSLIFTSYSMSRCFWCDHGYINVLRRFDASEMNVETMCEHQHVTFFQVWLNIFFVHISLQFIVDQDHDNVSSFSCFCSCIYFESLCFCFCPGFASFIQTNNNITSRLFCVQSMCMSLATVTDNGNCLSFQHR